MRIRPTETINLIALAVLTCLGILLRHRLADFRGMLLGYAGLSLLVLVIVALAPREDRFAPPLTFFI
ncbi:MAG TPA: hypothetical protein VN032_06030, partial [Thermoanaerobaculia bacterium]|nr:hypothetical protein [Thermoanaerobaculia bacterium]